VVKRSLFFLGMVAVGIAGCVLGTHFHATTAIMLSASVGFVGLLGIIDG
jgi:hypothetical protein